MAREEESARYPAHTQDGRVIEVVEFIDQFDVAPGEVVDGARRLFTTDGRQLHAVTDKPGFFDVTSDDGNPVIRVRIDES